MREPPFGYPYWKDFALSPAPAGGFFWLLSKFLTNPALDKYPIRVYYSHQIEDTPRGI